MGEHEQPIVIDQRTALHNIISQLLPKAAKSLTERSPSRRITSRLQQNDYDDIRSHLLKMKVAPNPMTASATIIRPPKQQQTPQTATPNTSPRKSRRRIFEEDGSFEPEHRFSKRILKQNRISTATSKPIPQPVRAFLTTHVNRLIEPMHDTIALKIQRDSLNAKSNISRALGRYAINKEYYHRMYHENGKEMNPEIRQFLDKKKAILEQNARTIHTSDFYQNRRLFKKIPQTRQSPQRGYPPTEANEYREFCQRIIEYSKDEPRRNSDAEVVHQEVVDVYRNKPVINPDMDESGTHDQSLYQQVADSHKYLPQRSKSNVDVRRTKLPFNVDLKEFELEARALERLMHEKKSTMTRVDIHQRNLNRDEKKLRTMVNLADYIGYS